LKKILTIIKSRFKKNKEEEDWVLKRREICKLCKYNSKNAEKIEITKKLIIKLSDFYSFITGKKQEDNLGNCTICGCSLFYLTSEKESYCKKEFWKEEN
jgi:ribosomal protein S24E